MGAAPLYPLWQTKTSPDIEKYSWEAKLVPDWNHCPQPNLLARQLSLKESTCQAGVVGDPSVRNIPWRRKWHPLHYPCLSNPMGRGAWRTTHSPWGSKESDTTEWLSMHARVGQAIWITELRRNGKSKISSSRNKSLGLAVHGLALLSNHSYGGEWFCPTSYILRWLT